MTKSSPYNRRWQKARLSFLRKHPLCSMCNQLGVAKAATVVDHIIPHRDNHKLFWDTANWQALCKPCHDRHKQAQENSGQLLYAEDRAKYYAEFNVEGLLRGDSKARAEFYSKMTQNGIFTRNEVRKRENLQRASGGDDLTVQSNMMALKSIELEKNHL